MTQQPPIGIMPRYIWDEIRLRELAAAISRYAAAYRPVPAEWIEEYNELIKRYDLAHR
jgi:hypothetical protein